MRITDPSTYSDIVGGLSKVLNTLQGAEIINLPYVNVIGAGLDGFRKVFVIGQSILEQRR
jgi:hypothetical protein